MKRFGLLMATLLACCVITPALLGMHGCSDVRSAYKAAENPADLSFVLVEHYAALVKAAADIAQKPGTPPQVIVALKAADWKARPVIERLRPLRDAYLATKSAKTEQELLLATDQAVIAIADLVRAVNAARGAQ